MAAAKRHNAKKRGIRMTRELPRVLRLCASAIVLGALYGPGAFLPLLAQEAPRTGAPPILALSAPGVAWAGFVAPKEPNYAIARLFNDFGNPPTGIGPVSDDPAHPYVNNEVAREMKAQPTFRVADLNNAAGRNLMPWAREALRQQNEHDARGTMLGNRRSRL